jgi:hypothetical protein
LYLAGGLSAYAKCKFKVDDRSAFLLLPLTVLIQTLAMILGGGIAKKYDPRM